MKYMRGTGLTAIVGMAIALWLVTPGIFAQTVVFDDFSYTTADDPALGSFNQWSVVSGTNGPPSGASYLKSNVTFTPDGLMQLRCANSGTVASATHARLESKEVVYFEGTYAARVFFDDSPHDFQDPVIQTFYAISPSSGGQNPTTYAEVDFEYLPWDSWNGLYNNNYAHAMWMSSYESARVLTDGLDNDHQFIKQSIGGAWHTLLFRFTDGQHVEYFIDGALKATLSTRAGDGVSVYPDYNMLVSFANWGYPPIEGTSFGSATTARSSTMQVDWFVYVADESKSTAEIETMVETFRDGGVSRKNRLGQTQGPGVTTSVEGEVQRLSLHPNPAGEKVFVDSAPGHTVVIHDVMGRTVLTGCTDSNKSIDVSTLHGGMYTAGLAVGNGQWLWARFFKQ